MHHYTIPSCEAFDGNWLRFTFGTHHFEGVPRGTLSTKEGDHIVGSGLMIQHNPNSTICPTNIMSFRRNK